MPISPHHSLPTCHPLCVLPHRPPEPIPIPVVERVTSPWAQADQLPTQTPASQAAGTAARPGVATGRPSLSQPGAGGRRSLLGVSNMRRRSSAGGSGQPPLEGNSKVPTPWSALRPWDGHAGQDKEQQQQQQTEQPPGGDENRSGPPQEQQLGDLGVTEQRPASDRRKPSSHAEQTPVATAGPDSSLPPGPTTGCIALTSVDGGVVELARSAARRLRGLRVCPEGREEGQVTHLVIGGARRTLKLMLAVANGAWLLSPQWVTASLEAGRWLPESQFPAKVGGQGGAGLYGSLHSLLSGSSCGWSYGRSALLPCSSAHALGGRRQLTLPHCRCGLRRLPSVLAAGWTTPMPCHCFTTPCCTCTCLTRPASS
jgi:hypothetical protein